MNGATGVPETVLDREDRGKDVRSAPWYPVFQGDRINDHHLTLSEERAARAASANVKPS